MTAIKKDNDQKTQDLLKRNANIAEKQSQEDAARVFKKGDEYYCGKCKSEISMHRFCPNCQAQLDWDSVKAELGEVG